MMSDGPERTINILGIQRLDALNLYKAPFLLLLVLTNLPLDDTTPNLGMSRCLTS